MEVANRLAGVGEYYFSQKLREIELMNKAGKQVINLGIGSPDLPPHPDVINTLHEESVKHHQHAYQGYKGSIVFRNVIAKWYRQWYNVHLDPEHEILPLIGSKEGIMHICMTYLNEGDGVLVPNPGYPTYSSAVKIAGGRLIEYRLKESNHWFPDFDTIEKSGMDHIKLMFVNYPQMPTGQLPTVDLFNQLIKFAQKHGILLIHDNPYSFILNEEPLSLLQVPGAMDVVIELNSLSKSHNMAGWRVGMLCAKKERVDEILRFKSNMDSGMFLPVQLAAAKALEADKDWHHKLNSVYTSRREKAFELLKGIDCEFAADQAGMFVWAKIPATEKDGYSLSDRILHEANVFITPGGIFGSEGNAYVRVSLCTPESRFEEAIQRIQTSKTN